MHDFPEWACKYRDIKYTHILPCISIFLVLLFTLVQYILKIKCVD